MSRTKKDTKEEKYTENPIYNYFLLLMFAILICIFTTYKISGDDDTFWHLATGKYITENHQVPSADVFGYITEGKQWIPFEWGWDVMTYMIYSIGGYEMLSVFRTLIVLGIFALVFSLLRKSDVSLSIGIIFSFLLILGILARLAIRPQLITYLFIILLIFILVNYEGKKNIYIYAPLMFLIWGNMHMGVILGMSIFILFIVAKIIEYKTVYKNINKKDKNPEIKYLLIAFLFSVVALLINPNFLNTYIYAFSHTQMDMLEHINEWKSPLRAESLSYYYIKIYIFFLITGLIIVFYSIKRKEYFPMLIYLSIGIYSLQSMRFVADFMIAVFVFLVLASDFFLKKFKFSKYINSIAVKIILSVLLIFTIISSYNNSFYTKCLGNYFRETGFGVNEKFFPKTMFDFVKREEINLKGKRPFNNLKIGGYFIWNFPESKNFIDSRNLYDDIYASYKNIDLKRQGFEALIEKYNIDYFMYSTPYLTVSAREIEKNIVSYLSISSDKWKLVYWDDKSFLFVKNIPEFKEIIERHEYKYISPYNFIFNTGMLRSRFESDRIPFTNEVRRKLTEEPNGIIINDIAKYFKM